MRTIRKETRNTIQVRDLATYVSPQGFAFESLPHLPSPVPAKRALLLNREVFAQESCRSFQGRIQDVGHGRSWSKQAF